MPIRPIHPPKNIKAYTFLHSYTFKSAKATPRPHANAVAVLTFFFNLVMLNKQFFTDPKDELIVRLRLAISRFKAYDQKRKEYIKNLEKENKWLYEELQLAQEGKASETYKALQKQNHDLAVALQHRAMSDKYTDEQIQQWQTEVNYVNLRKQVATLQQHLKTLRATNTQLVTQLNTMKNHQPPQPLQ